MHELIPHLKKYFSFSKREYFGIIISSAIFSFILTFRQWGETTFDVTQGILNLILSFIIIIISMFLHISFQKIVAVYLGYRAHYNYWLNGLLIGLLMVFMSYGFIPILFVGTVTIEHLAKLRLGKFRYGLNYRDLAVVSLAGPITNLLLVLIISPFFISNQSALLLKIINLNLIFALFSLLPIPTIKGLKLGKGGTPGFNVLFYSRALYIFSVVVIIIYFLLISIARISSLIIACIIAGLCTYIFIRRMEE